MQAPLTETWRALLGRLKLSTTSLADPDVFAALCEILDHPAVHEACRVGVRTADEAARRAIVQQLLSLAPLDSFSSPDGPGNLVMAPDDDGVAQIKAATLEKLVERLTHQVHPDFDLRSVFMLTYREFATPTELLALLARRFERAEMLREQCAPIRIKVFSVLKHWLEHHFYDFEDPVLRARISAYIEELLMTARDESTGPWQSARSSLQLKRLLARKERESDRGNWGRPLSPLSVAASATPTSVWYHRAQQKRDRAEAPFPKPIVPPGGLSDSLLRPSAADALGGLYLLHPARGCSFTNRLK